MAISHVVPPVPKDLPPAEMLAFRLWRRGYSVRMAATAAGIPPRRLFIILETAESEVA